MALKSFENYWWEGGGGGGHPAPSHPFILQNCVIAYQRYKGVLNYSVIRITLRLRAGSAREIPAHMRVLGLMSPMRFINPIAKFQSSHFGLITHSG